MDRLRRGCASAHARSGGRVVSDAHLATPSGKPRARALGIPFAGEPGPWNAITDVPGVEVGFVTLISGQDVRTGVTAIHPRGRAEPGDPFAAGFHSQNGNGEMTGGPGSRNRGPLPARSRSTNTHAVGIAHAGVVAWTAIITVAAEWLLPVARRDVGRVPERHQRRSRHRRRRGRSASTGPVEEGSVGGGSGMNCYVQGRVGDGLADDRVRRGPARRGVRADQFRRTPRADDRRGARGRSAAGRRPDLRALLDPAGCRLGHRGGRDAPLLPDQC